MAQLSHQASQQGVWLVAGPPSSAALQLGQPLQVTFSDGTTAALSAHVPAITSTSATQVDRTAAVWVAYVVKGETTLRLAKEADLPTLAGDYAPLARLLIDRAEPYQPEAYLGAGGVGGPALASTTTLASSAGQGKVLHIGAGGTLPAGWTTVSFNDSAWAVSVLESSTTLGSPIAGTQWVTYLSGTAPALDEWLFREQLVLPVGAVTSATLQIWADNTVVNAYVNGTSVVSGYSATVGGSPTSVDVSALLTPGSANQLAVHVLNDSAPTSNPTSLDVLLTAVGSLSGAVDPTSAEGDLIYRHSGALTRLPIGSGGDVLASNGTDPLYRALVASDIPALGASIITSGALASARGGTGLDTSAAANGCLLIGNGSGLSLSTLTAGSGVTITNGAGSVTVAASGGGGASFSWTTKTANYTITTSDSGILGDATSGSITITLPTAVGATQTYTVKKKDSSSNTVSVATTSSQTIDGATTFVIRQQYLAITLASDGSNWYIA